MRIFLLAAAALSFPANALAAAPAQAAQPAAEVRLAHIAITTAGDGPAVVLIPGLSSPRTTWDGVTAKLRPGHRIILVQVNGFAGDDPGANLQPGILNGIVEDLNTYLEREKLAPVRLVGHSLGGLASLLFAAAHPDKVHDVMVVDALPFFPVLMNPGATVEQAKPIAAMMRDKVAAAYGKPVDLKAVEASVKNLALKPESVAQVKTWAAAADPRVTAEALYEDMTTDARPLLPAIKAPITVLVPWSASGFGREATMAFYAKQYAVARTVRFADIAEAGHFVMLDQPAAFQEAIDAFVDR